MSTVGSKTKVKLTDKGVAMASKAASTRGSVGQHYYEAVSTRIESGAKAGEAIKEVAAAEGTSTSNVSNAFYRVKRQVEGNGSAPSSRGRTASSTASVSVPKDLAPLLDAIRKDRQSLSANVDKLIAWANAQEENVKNAQENAREAALRQIREAAANIK